MFIRDLGHGEQLSRWGLDHLAGVLAFPAQVGPPPNIPHWQKLSSGSHDCCYRLGPAPGDPAWLFHPLYLKQFRFNPPTWRYLFRRSRASREAANLAELARLGIPCPQVVAGGEKRQAGGPLTGLLFKLLVGAAMLGVLALGLGLLMRSLGGPRFGGELVEFGVSIAAGAGGAIAAIALTLGLLHLLGRDYFVGAALILTAIEPSQDLARFAYLRWQRPFRGDPVQATQVRRLARQLADQLAVAHRARFVHGDLKFRNLLVCWPKDQDPGRDNLRLAWIDCPRGRRMVPGPWLARRRIKDLANLDRNAAPFLSRTQRLRFLRDYLLARGGEDALTDIRRIIRKIAAYNRRHTGRYQP